MDDYEYMSGSDDPLGIDQSDSSSDSSSTGAGWQDYMSASTGLVSLLVGHNSTATTAAQSAPLAPLQGAVVSSSNNNTIVWVIVALVVVVILYKVL